MPFRFKRGNVYNNPAPGVRAFTYADGNNVPWDTEVFVTKTKGKTVWGNNDGFPLLNLYRYHCFRVKVLRVHYCAVGVCEDFERPTDPDVVPKGTQPVR